MYPQSLSYKTQHHRGQHRRHAWCRLAQHGRLAMSLCFPTQRHPLASQLVDVVYCTRRLAARHAQQAKADLVALQKGANLAIPIAPHSTASLLADHLCKALHTTRHDVRHEVGYGSVCKAPGIVLSQYQVEQMLNTLSPSEGSLCHKLQQLIAQNTLAGLLLRISLFTEGTKQNSSPHRRRLRQSLRTFDGGRQIHLIGNFDADRALQL